MKKFIFFCFLAFFFLSCSENKLNDFEQVEKEPDFKLFEILDNYPALKGSLSNMNEHEVNLLLAEAVNKNVKEAKILFSLFPQTVEYIVKLIADFDKILQKTINQDNLDETEGKEYSKYLYTLLDDFFKEYYQTSSDIIQITQKIISYFLDTQSDSIEEKITLLTNFLKDENGQSLKTILPLLNEGFSKILLKKQSEMIVNGEKTDLGQAVKGFDAILSGFNDIFSKDEEARKAFIDFLYASGDIFSAEINGKKSSEVFRELLINIQKYSIQGGNVYDANSNYNQNNNGIYVNTSIINGVKELWPSFVELFIKAKGYWENENIPDYSKIYDPQNAESVMEYLTHQFYQLKLTADIDLNDKLSDYGNGGIEKSLLKMVKYNAYGKKRTEADYKVSYLDHVLYTLTSAYDFGYLTRNGSNNEPYVNHGYGHGKRTGGIITLNDTLYSMTTGEKIDTLHNKHNAYSLALAHRTEQAEYIFRASEPFNATEASNYKFYMGYDFPALTLLNGFSVGDAGLPNGGKHVGKVKKAGGIFDINTISDITDGEDFKTYYPKVENGFGELNTSRWVMGWIARACWEGEGPYYSTTPPKGKPATANIDINGDGNKETVNIYYLPSGEIYAYVYKKDPQNRNTWKYFYPVNPKDKEDLEAPMWENMHQRSNRYKDKWHTDYFLFKSDYSDGNRETKYYSFNSVIGQSGQDKYLMAKYRNKQIVSQTPVNKAGTLWFYEKIKENDPKRECKTQEEAMFRNYQWLMFEKKMVFTIPMRAYVHQSIMGQEIDVDASIMNIIEANGIQGVANAKKGPGNGIWNLKGNEGTDEGTPQEETEINYGNSFLPGDSRVMVFMKEDGYFIFSSDLSGDKVDLDTIYNLILGENHVLPDIVGQNLAPISNMAFISDKIITSDSDIIGNNKDKTWKERNKLFPIIVALVSNLHRNTYYEVNTDFDRFGYNFEGNHKFPIKLIRDLIFMLGQPLIRHFDTYGGRWVPRMNYEKDFNEDSAFFAPYNEGVDYRPKENLKSVISILSENEFTESDGLLPLLSKTQIITNMLNFLQMMGQEGGIYDDKDKTSSDYTKWGARRKIFYGMEQILTSIKTSKGIATDRGYFKIKHPDWFFKKQKYDLDLDIILNEIIGSKETNKGIYLFVKNRPQKSDWNNFDFTVNMLGAMLSDKTKYADKYRILNHIINISTNILKGFTASPKQLSALRHTIGMLFAYYDKENEKWLPSNETKNILTVYLPQILEVYKGNYKAAFIVLKSMTRNNGLIEYFLKNINTDEKSEKIIKELHEFLSSNLIANKNSSFWHDISKLMTDLADMLEEEQEY